MENGVVLQDTTKVMISKAPSLIKNEPRVKELSRYGQLVFPIRMVSLGCKSPKLKHIFCHRRQVMMILKDKESDLNLSFSLNFNGYNYMVFASSQKMLGALGTQRERWSARTASPGTRSG